jgi:hypothetical protein
MRSRDSSVGAALGYGLDDRGSRVRFPAGDGNFSLHHRVQNGSGPHPASSPVGTRGSFPGVKAAGAWSWPLPQYVFMTWCLVKYRDNFTFTFLLFTLERRDLRLSWRWGFESRSSGSWLRVMYDTSVLEDFVAYRLNRWRHNPDDLDLDTLTN